MGKQSNGNSNSTLIQPQIPNPGYSVSSAGSSGALQVLMGVMCMIFQISATAVGASMGDIAAGIWGGVIFIIAGAIGISSTRESTCSIVMYMLTSMLSFLCSVAIITLSSMGINDDRNDVSQYCVWTYDWDLPYSWGSKCHEAESKVALNSMLDLFAFIMVFTSIYAQVLCCRGVCCCAPTYTTYVEQHQHYGTTPAAVPQEATVAPAYQQHSQPSGQVVVLVPSQENPGQYVAVPYQGEQTGISTVYSSSPPPGYAYEQPTAAVQATQS